jgi:hypothetical protein
MLNEPTAEVLRPMPAIGETIDVPLNEKTIHIHFGAEGFHWFGAEYDPEKEVFFGFIALRDIAHSNWGEFPLYQLRLANIRHTPRVQLDEDWTPRPFAQVAGANQYMASFPETVDPRAKVREAVPAPPPAPGSRGTLVYGEIGNQLHFLPKVVAEEYAEHRRALMNATTWEAFKKAVSPQSFVEVMQYLGREQPPAEDEEFDPKVLEHWVGWPAEEDPPWVPKEILEEFGCLNVPMHELPYTYFYIDEEEEVVAAFVAHGFKCESSFLIDKAFGMM